MVTKAEYDSLKKEYDKAISMVKEQSKNLRRLSARELELEGDVKFNENMFRQMKVLAEKNGSETAKWKSECLRLRETVERFEREKKQK